MKNGDKVTWRDKDRGIVKRVTNTHAFVVFNCDNNWCNYQNYTAAACNISDLREGWLAADLTEMGVTLPEHKSNFGHPRKWDKLIYELCKLLLEEGWDGQIAQTKAKFGRLRFYIKNYDPTKSKLHQIIHKAELLSLYI